MKLFVQMILDKDDNRKILKDIEYHKIGSVFKCNIGSKEIELEVVDTAKVIAVMDVYLIMSLIVAEILIVLMQIEKTM